MARSEVKLLVFLLDVALSPRVNHVILCVSSISCHLSVLILQMVLEPVLVRSITCDKLAYYGGFKACFPLLC